MLRTRGMYLFRRVWIRKRKAPDRFSKKVFKNKLSNFFRKNLVFSIFFENVRKKTKKSAPDFYFKTSKFFIILIFSPFFFIFLHFSFFILPLLALMAQKQGIPVLIICIALKFPLTPYFQGF